MLSLRVIETSTEDNLFEFSEYLWRQGLPHRVFEESGRQILEIGPEVAPTPVKDAYQLWRDGRLDLSPETAGPNPAGNPTGWVQVKGQLLSSPAILGCIALAILCYPSIASLREPGAWAQGLLFDPNTPWRWVTPAFVHFGLPHLALNCAAVWEIGRRNEAGFGTLGAVFLLCWLAAVSNWVQFLWSGNILFGGLSGVAYGLLGSLMVLSRLQPNVAHWQLPQGFETGLLIFLVLFSTGLTEGFGLHVANAAHWGGLIAGLAAGGFYHLLGRGGRVE